MCPMFLGKDSSISKNGAPERSFSKLDSGLANKHWTGLQALAFPGLVGKYMWFISSFIKF
jgi:hypothetical protein